VRATGDYGAAVHVGGAEAEAAVAAAKRILAAVAREEPAVFPFEEGA
jgi:hypothetical protein